MDNHRACVGGLDICFGRWDTHTHPLADVHPTDFERTLFPGQDYNNARVLDFKDVQNYVSNGLSIIETARMPWHDVSVMFTLVMRGWLMRACVGAYDAVWPDGAGLGAALCGALERGQEAQGMSVNDETTIQAHIASHDSTAKTRTSSQ